MVMLVQFQSSYFLHKIHSNALLLRVVVIEICTQKIFFVIKVSLPWKWYETFTEILHYKPFLLPQFNSTNQILI